MSKQKGTSRVVWMGDEELEMLKTISDTTDLPQTQVLAKLVSAGLRAIAANGNRFEVPLRFLPLNHQDQARWSETETKPHQPARK